MIQKQVFFIEIYSSYSRMNSKLLAISVLVCVYVMPALATVELVIGGTTLTAGATTVLAAGLLGAKVLGLGLGLGLASRGRGV